MWKNNILHEQWMWRLFCRTAAACLGDSQGFQNHSQRAEFGESELEEIGSYKGSEKEPVGMVKERACLNPQGQREEDEKSGDGMNPVCDDHAVFLYDY